MAPTATALLPALPTVTAPTLRAPLATAPTLLLRAPRTRSPRSPASTAAPAPWAVAGYRMGQAALQKLGLARQSFDLDVTHRGPLEPQYACVADGASAATGASLGKVNLRLEAAPADGVVTVYKKKSTGQSVALRPTEAFRKRFLDVPREELGRAGAQVLSLKDEEIFEEVPGQVSKDPLDKR